MFHLSYNQFTIFLTFKGSIIERKWNIVFFFFFFCQKDNALKENLRDREWNCLSKIVGKLYIYIYIPTKSQTVHLELHSKSSRLLFGYKHRHK